MFTMEYLFAWRHLEINSVLLLKLLSVFLIDYTFKWTCKKKKTSKHVCERASIVVDRLENFLPLSMTRVIIFGVVEEFIHGTINTGSLTVSDHVDSSDGDSAVSERTHSELEIGSSVKCPISNEDTSSEDDVEDNESDNLISSNM